MQYDSFYLNFSDFSLFDALADVFHIEFFNAKQKGIKLLTKFSDLVPNYINND